MVKKPVLGRGGAFQRARQVQAQPPEDLQRTLWNAFTAPARAMTYTPETPELPGLVGDIHRAIDPVQAFGGYGNAVSQAMFAGPMARTYNPRLNARAMQLEAAGETPQAVHKQTGYLRGDHRGDTKWRHEIADNEARWIGDEKILTSEAQTLDNVISHNKIFDAYPQLRQVRVQFSDLPENTTAGFSRKNNTIHVNRSLPAKDRLNSLLHEIQHKVQQIEKFSSGSSPFREQQIARKNDTLAVERIEKILNKKSDIIDRNFSVKNDVENFKKLEAAEKKLRQFSAEKQALIDDERSAQRQYYNRPGEREARITQAREHLTPEERRNKWPGWVAKEARDD